MPHLQEQPGTRQRVRGYGMVNSGWGTCPEPAPTLLPISLNVWTFLSPTAMQDVAFHVWLLSCPVCLRSIWPNACPRMGTPPYCLLIPWMIDTWRAFPSFGGWE